MSAFLESKDWPEADYRKRVQETFDEVAAEFEDVDPDLAECELAFGVLTISFPDRTKIILSAQPSVRQLWIALASRGTAYHFSYDSQLQQWRDDKGRDIEVKSLLQKVLHETAGLNLWQKK
jgi:iron donor protein CyaY